MIYVYSLWEGGIRDYMQIIGRQILLGELRKVSPLLGFPVFTY